MAPSKKYTFQTITTMTNLIWSIPTHTNNDYTSAFLTEVANIGYLSLFSSSAISLSYFACSASYSF